MDGRNRPDGGSSVERVREAIDAIEVRGGHQRDGADGLAVVIKVAGDR